jgi:nitrate reductase NapAB chaperone NapD
METRSKILIGAVLALLVALPLMSTVLATSANGCTSNAGTSTGSQEDKPKAECLERLIKLQYPQYANLIKDFLKNAKNVTIEGTVVTHAGKILVVQTTSSRLNILLPPIWSVNTEDKVLNLTEVFNNYVKSGDTVTIKALERDFKNNNGVTISIIVAYEIMDTTSNNHLYAILPFNINP